MNAPAFATDSPPTAAYANPPVDVTAFSGSSDNTPEYHVMVRGLYFPPMPEIAWGE